MLFKNITYALLFALLFKRYAGVANVFPAVLWMTYRCCVFWGSLLCIPVQSHCVTVWCNPSMNASSQRRMSAREEGGGKLCQWFTWLLCRFTSRTSPYVPGLRCSTQCVSGGLCIFLVLCVHLYVLSAANSIWFSLDLPGLNYHLLLSNSHRSSSRLSRRHHRR